MSGPQASSSEAGSGDAPVHEEAIEKARIIVEAALELKAEDPLVLNMRGVSSFADTFIILTGRSDRHVHSVTDAIVHALREAGEEPLGVEGQEQGHWVLIDANDAIVHVFEPETREHFALERLWSDAPTLELATDLGIEIQPEPQGAQGESYALS